MRRLDLYLVSLLATAGFAFGCIVLGEAIDGAGHPPPAPISAPKYEFLKEQENGWLVFNNRDGTICLVPRNPTSKTLCRGM